MRLIDADELRKQMYHEAFEKDTDMQRWDSGCWIRYKMFENAIKTAPTIDPVKHGRWIPCEERMPEEPFGCLVTVMDTEPMTCAEFENILPYFVGWDGEQWNDGDGEQCPFEVLAWMRLPEPYKMNWMRWEYE